MARRRERAECPRLHNQLDYIAEARAKSDKPIFLFSHLTIPHDPITMDADGNCIEHVYCPGHGTKFSDYQKAYAGYVWCIVYARPLILNFKEFTDTGDMLVLEFALDTFYYEDAISKVKASAWATPHW